MDKVEFSQNLGITITKIRLLTIEELEKYNELRQKLNKEIDAEIGEEARKKLEEDARKNLDSGIGKEEILTMIEKAITIEEMDEDDE